MLFKFTFIEKKKKVEGPKTRYSLYCHRLAVKSSSQCNLAAVKYMYSTSKRAVDDIDKLKMDFLRLDLLKGASDKTCSTTELRSHFYSTKSFSANIKKSLGKKGIFCKKKVKITKIIDIFTADVHYLI